MNFLQIAQYLPLLNKLLELLQELVVTNKSLVASNEATQESNKQVIAALHKQHGGNHVA